MHAALNRSFGNDKRWCRAQQEPFWSLVLAPGTTCRIQASAEDIPLENNSVDSVLITFTLCTVPNPQAALAEARRTLKPSGKLYFCEHGIAPDESVAKWQRRINPVWKRVFGGCNITRDTRELLREAGFTVDAVEQMYLPGTPSIAGFNTWGDASIA